MKLGVLVAGSSGSLCISMGLCSSFSFGEVSILLLFIPMHEFDPKFCCQVKVLSSLRHPNFIHYYGCVSSKLHLSLVTGMKSTHTM